MSYFGLVWNRWCTSRRFQQNDKCVLCGKVGTRDSVEHYASCVTVLLLASYMVGTIPSNLDTYASRIAYFFGLPFKRKEDRLRRLLWIHAVYTLKMFLGLWGLLRRKRSSSTSWIVSCAV